MQIQKHTDTDNKRAWRTLDKKTLITKQIKKIKGSQREEEAKNGCRQSEHFT